MLGGCLVTTAWWVLIADGGEYLEVRKLAVNILNKKSRTADKGWFSGLGLGMGLASPHHKNLACYKMFQSASDLYCFFGTT